MHFLEDEEACFNTSSNVFRVQFGVNDINILLIHIVIIISLSSLSNLIEKYYFKK